MGTRHIFRLVMLAVVFILISLVFIGRLINIQIAERDFYTYVSDETYTRTVTIQAQRGEIFDCNGVPLIKNEYTYDVLLDKGTLPQSNAELNENLMEIYKKIKLSDTDYTVIPLPFPAKGKYPNYELDEDFFDVTENRARFSRFIAMLGLDDIGTIISDVTYPYALSYYENTLSSATLERNLYLLDLTMHPNSTTVSIDDVIEILRGRYGLYNAKEDEEYYTPEVADFLIRLRYSMEAMDFSASNPFTVVKDADIALITYLEEGSLRGFNVRAVAKRVYCEPGVASHILGRTGKIQSKDVDYYTELGYKLDAIVGLDGVERAFESYLHGIDGKMIITEDEYGNIINREVAVEPIAGNDVYLTIDIELQRAAEKALYDNIEYIHERAAAVGEELSGEDANVGALTVVSVESNAVLALASYPSYDLATFNENYAELSADADAPLYNRALNGQYPPGSTFKPAVAAAALSEGIVTSKTIIDTQGKYDYYEESGFTPRCWLYVSSGKVHGPINISEAIKVSCNYFFYEIGRLLTIDTMNKYCRAFGLGEETGIELSEKTGALAGPDYREENGLDAWNPGDTLAAAIGQSDNLFTPLQISVYMSSLINCGTRYNAHILKCVRTFGTNEVIYETPARVMSEINVKESDVQVILDAMQTVVESGVTATLFDNYPIKVGGKTGTAQVSSNHSDNAVFVGFAPFDSPEIVATCVIERGAKGAWAGMAVRDAFTEYFDLTIGGGDDVDDGESE